MQRFNPRSSWEWKAKLYLRHTTRLSTSQSLAIKMEAHRKKRAEITNMILKHLLFFENMYTAINVPTNKHPCSTCFEEHVNMWHWHDIPWVQSYLHALHPICSGLHNYSPLVTCTHLFLHFTRPYLSLWLSLQENCERGTCHVHEFNFML